MMIPSVDQLKKGFRNPWKAITYLSTRAYKNAVVTATSRAPIGTNILSKNWDVCVILDACRVDALRSVSDEYPFLGQVDRIWSLGGSTPEWMARTFDTKNRGQLAKTAYLTANAWADRILFDGSTPAEANHELDLVLRLLRYGKLNVIQSNEFGHIEQIWKFVPVANQVSSKQDPDGLMPGGSPPRYVTDRAIKIGRESEFDRMILHYIQPHAPYMSKAIAEGRELQKHEKRPFKYLRETDQRETVWNSYIEELRYALDDVELLLNNIDADEVAITADHGEAFGEYNTYMHDTGSLHPHIRFVPWTTTSATDSGTYTPEVKLKQRDISVDETLEALGYKS